MIQIRRSIFETNSSSTHSLIMLNQDKPVTNYGYYIHANELIIYERYLDFGRTFNYINNWYERLCFAIASYGKDGFKKIKNIIKSRLDCDLIILWDYANEEEELHDSYEYIDHQSIGMLQHFLSEHNITLEDFIFNDRYIVIIDGDEYNYFLDMWKDGIIDKRNIKYWSGKERIDN